jgi:hypothetical protein
VLGIKSVNKCLKSLVVHECLLMFAGSPKVFRC